jgi:hypothetical protein
MKKSLNELHEEMRLSARGAPPVRPSPVQTVRAPPSRTTQSLDARALIRSEVLVGATIGPPPGLPVPKKMDPLSPLT